MKIKSKPQEYEAIEFKDEIEVCHAVQEFLGSSGTLICEPDKKILSLIIGNIVLSDGDIIYKTNNLFISVIKKDKTFDDYFEVVK